MDRALISPLADTLDAALTGSRVQRIYRRALSGGAVLQMHGRGKSGALLIQIASPEDRLQLLDTPDPWRADADAATMLLRQQLIGATLTSVAAATEDRRITLSWRRAESTLSLEVELYGHFGGWALIGGNNTALYAVGPSMRRRGIYPNSQWSPSPARPPGDWSEPEGPALDPDDVSAATEVLRQREDQRLLAAERSLQARSLKRAGARIERAIKALERDELAAMGHARLRHEADLLQTMRGRLERGAAEATVHDWLDGGAETTITLDPAESLEEQIERRYKRARKLERSGPAIAMRRRQLQLRGEANETQRQRLAELSDDELRELAIARLTKAKAERARQQPKRQPWMRAVSSDGLEILVGRGGADNDTLTFKVARGNDLWFHASDYPGAHVILRTPRGSEPPRRSIEEAALLAAHYSGGAKSAALAVRYTARKHLRKPAGMPPGRVLVAAAKNIDVKLDPERVRQLHDRAAAEPSF